MCDKVPCRESEDLREDLRAAEWDVRSLEDELEKANGRIRRIREELGAHTRRTDPGWVRGS